MSERAAEEEIREEHRVIEELLGRTFGAPLKDLGTEVSKIKTELLFKANGIREVVRELDEKITDIEKRLSKLQEQYNQSSVAIADVGKVEHCVKAVHALGEQQNGRLDEVLEKALSRVARLEAVLCRRLRQHVVAFGIFSVVYLCALVGLFWMLRIT